MTDEEKDKEIVAAVLAKLTELNIPAETQEMLILGDPSLGIPPGALSKIIWMAIGAERTRDLPWYLAPWTALTSALLPKR